MHYVYILKCSNDTLYTGCTNNLQERFQRHSSGWVESTKRLLPLTLVFYSAFSDKYKAYAFEKYLKSGSGKAFLKKRLI
jgi:putative endonuclease